MKHITLEGAWRLKIPGRKRPIQANVPGCVHTGLIACGLLRDPLAGGSAEAGRAIALDGAAYEREFTLNPVPEHGRVFILFKGLDTFASIHVNGTPVARTDNMFRQWRFDITSAVHPGVNTVSVSFTAPGPIMEEAEKRLPLECPARPGEPAGRTHIRKRRADFGSDYSPCLPPAGIWREVFVEFANTARILSAIPRQTHGGDKVEIEVSAACEVFGPVEDLRIVAHVVYRGLQVAKASAQVGADGRATLVAVVRNPQLWWPNGMGEQPLYELQVELLSERRQLDFITRRIGLRTYRIQSGTDGESANGGGDRFRLLVNGVPMLVRGAVWSTPDVFVSRPTRVEYARLVKAANVANLNLLRVAGDGVYEKDYFYDLCDEYGICVWQDFMFSDAAYPFSDPAFAEGVRGEVEDVVPRLAAHACLALWCGGDRLSSHVADPGAASENAKMPLAAYDAIVGKMLPDTVGRLSPGTPYITDSTAHGIGSIQDIGKDKRAYSRDCAPFYSSFGFPSLPSTECLRLLLPPEESSLDSETMKAHITAPYLMERAKEMMGTFFKPPRDFESAAILSQIQQGLACKTLAEHWRRQGGRFGGAIVSRLDNAWPCLCDSSVNPDGRWKCMHHFIRHFWADPIVTGLPNVRNGTLDVFVHNDSREKFAGKISWRIVDTSGHVLREMEKAVAIPPEGPLRLGAIRLGDVLRQLGPGRVLVWLRLASFDGHSISTDCIRFALPRDMALEDPEIKADIRKWDEHCFAVTLRATKPALWSWLDFPPSPAKFDENFICLAPGKPVRIRITPLDHFSLADFKKGLRIHSLYDTYEHG